ncbi:MAG TPA: orotate phosphoribosyltransferase [Anaerolineae bacterium]
MADSQTIACDLFDIGCVKFGQFKLKSGLISPIYIDLRLLVTYPEVLRKVAQAMVQKIAQSALTFDRLAAIPYAGLPIGVSVALESGLPLIYPRKEAKDYGTAKIIEGVYHPGETVLLVDDLITKGTAKIESLKPLTDARLLVKDVLVLIDREQGGAAEMNAHGVALHAVTTLTAILDELVATGRLTAQQRSDISAWIKAN